MAVYTKLSDVELLETLSHFSIAPVRYTEGITKDTENSHYFVETSSDRYVLTIFEQRINVENIPFVLEVLHKLGEANIICPNVIAAKSGQKRHTLANGKICILQTFMDGEDVLVPSSIQCYAAGKTLANIHNVSPSIGLSGIQNLLDIPSLNTLYDEMNAMTCDSHYDSVKKLIFDELKHQEKTDFKDLPYGLIHGEYFKDNVLFTETFVSGVIDFWFSSDGTYIYDLAVALNAWGFKNGVYCEESFDAFLQGYTDRRTLNDLEKKYLPNKLRLASLKILIRRLYSELNENCNINMKNKPFQTWEKRLQYNQNKQWNF